MNRQVEYIISMVIDILTFGVWWSLTTQIHKDLTTEDCHFVSSKSSYSEFKRDFSKIDWSVSNGEKYSLFGQKPNYQYDYIHAGVIRINGDGYLLTTFGLIRANILIRKTYNEVIKQPSKLKRDRKDKLKNIMM